MSESINNTDDHVFEYKYYLSPSKYEYFEAMLGTEWVERNCVMVNLIPSQEDDNG